MGKKKGNKSDDPAELQAVKFHIVELVGKVRALDSRIRNLITYVEYIAGNLDVSVDYAEYLGEIISRDKGKQPLGNFGIVPSERAPSFLEFKKGHCGKSDVEVL